MQLCSVVVPSGAPLALLAPGTLWSYFCASVVGLNSSHKYSEPIQLGYFRAALPHHPLSLFG